MIRMPDSKAIGITRPFYSKEDGIEFAFDIYSVMLNLALSFCLTIGQIYKF